MSRSRAGSVVPGLPDGSKLLAQAFAAKKGDAPQVSSTGEGYAVFQVTDIQAAHAPTFADYKSYILDDYREQQLPQLLPCEHLVIRNHSVDHHAPYPVRF